PSRPGFEYLPGERISGVSGRGRGAVARPVGNGPAAALRDLATLDSPIMRVPGEVPLDANGKIPWLLPEHDVQRLGQHTYVNVVGIGDEGAQLVGRRLGADVYNHADPNTTSYGGLGIDGLAGQREQAAVASALQARGLPVLREQVGTGVRVPLTGGKIGDLARTVQDVLNTEGLTDATVGSYTGETHAVGSGRARVARGAAAAARALGLPAGNDIRGQQLAAGLFRDAPIPAYPGATPPGLGGVGGVASRQRAQAQLPFAINLGGAAVGGAAGAAATPEGAPPEERLRNIGLGASAGLLGTAALTRGLRPLETAPGRVSEGFRAPERPTGLELRATTQEPPGGPGGPGERPPTTVSGGVPRSLEQVHSNPYAMREAGPGETPMTSDEMLSYADELERRYEAVQNRRDAIDEMIRNPGQKIDRPRWAAGLTNDQVAEIARAHGASPYEEGWADRVGLEEGSGEVRYALREGGYLGDVRRMSKTPTPAELRAERTRLDAELGDIQSAHEQMANAPAEPNLVRVRSAEEAARAERPAELPFDTGAPDETPASVAEAQGGLDEGARLAQEIVLSKGRGTLRSDQGTVSLEQGNVRSTALVSNEEIQRATEGAPSARTEANMPNLNAMLEGEPEIAAQIRKAADDNPDLFEAYRQGRISMDSLRNDLAKRVGMTVQDWNKTKIGQGFNEREMVALQAAAVEQQGRMMDTAQSIVAKGGVDALTPEELVFSAATLADATKILAVARGGRSTAGRTLNALKQRFDRTMASGITAANERLAAQKTAAQARRAAARATTVLAKGRELEREATTARAEASRNGAPRNILQQIDQAYAEL
ncbi:MAG TPA: hypothetical protein VFB50_13270, partial [Chloroflexota bacterium]|nr:hypothetical protein [Chloroflexota bacterium]